jgi:hypothetical protein
MGTSGQRLSHVRFGFNFKVHDLVMTKAKMLPVQQKADTGTETHRNSVAVREPLSKREVIK